MQGDDEGGLEALLSGGREVATLRSRNLENLVDG